MGGIVFTTPEEAKDSMPVKLLYLAYLISSLANILPDLILIKATISNK
jgi:hypothetical protein